MKLNDELDPKLTLDDIMRLAMESAQLEEATVRAVKEIIRSRVEEINGLAGVTAAAIKDSPGFTSTETRNDEAKVRRVVYSFRGHVVLVAMDTLEQFTLTFCRHE